jgi:hypothetical protein
MTFKTSSILTSFAFIFISCLNSKSENVGKSKSWFDPTAFPKKTFSYVSLFVLDSSEQTEISSNSGTIRNRDVLEYVGSAAYSFVDSSGIPKTKKVTSYDLDSTQIKTLESFLVQQPCITDSRLDNTCAPIIRNVFVFYDEDRKPIAVVHVCFRCQKTIFNPYADYMCDFNNKVNYKTFKEFTNSIKSKR